MVGPWIAFGVCLLAALVFAAVAHRYRGVPGRFETFFWTRAAARVLTFTAVACLVKAVGGLG